VIDGGKNALGFSDLSAASVSILPFSAKKTATLKTYVSFKEVASISNSYADKKTVACVL
jgi:hypothetical protein